MLAVGRAVFCYGCVCLSCLLALEPRAGEKKMAGGFSSFLRRVG